MALFDCVRPCIICPPGLEGEQPGLNLTSEAPDEDPFIGYYWTWDPPPLNSIFTAVGCVSFCLSTVSQEEANLCAQRQDALCTSVKWPGGGTPGTPGGASAGLPRPLFGNTPQSCSSNCSDGNATITVPANTYFAFNQATANQMAHSLACLRATRTVICLSTISNTSVCLNQDSSVSILAPGAVQPCTFSLVGGVIPPGMSLVQDGSEVLFIAGTPTFSGQYSFTIRVVDDIGSVGSSTYDLSVGGITTSSFSNATESVYYSEIMDASGITGPLTWSVVAGALPTGLQLDPTTGEIYSTPTVPGTYNFTIQITNGSVQCYKDLSIVVEPASDCPVWDNIVWGAINSFFNGTGSGSGSALGGTVHLQCQSGPYSGGPSTASLSIQGDVNYTGPGGTCCLTITAGGSAIIPFQNGMDGVIQQDAVGILIFDANTPPGVLSFTVAPSVGVSVIHISLQVYSAALFATPTDKNISMDFVFGPCP